MPSMDVPLQIGLGKEAGDLVDLSVDFKVTASGCPAHMGSMSYPGHPAEPPEIEIETIFWPFKRWNESTGLWVADHIEFPHTGLPDEVYEAIQDHIVENYEPEDAFAE